MYLVPGPDSAAGDSAGGVDAHVEISSDGRAIVESERDVGNTNAAGERAGIGEIADVVILERGVAAVELWYVGGKASRCVVHDLVDVERSREALSGSRNGVDEVLRRSRHCCKMDLLGGKSLADG